MRRTLPVLALLVAVSYGCSSDNGPASGSVTVQVETTGSPIDPDGFQVVVGSGTAKPIGVNASLTIPDVNTGNTTVRLDGVSPNCGVQTTNPQPVTVSAGATATLQFKVVCAANSGLLRVTVTSSGQDIDADGYILQMGGVADRTVTANGNEPLRLTPEGTHLVGLSGLAPNCVPGPNNPTSVTVAKGDTVTLAFAVTCAHVPTVDVMITTSGNDIDPSFVVTASPGTTDDLRQPRNVRGAGVLHFAKVWPGNWRFQVDSIAPNCHLISPTPVDLSVASTDLQVAFRINCVALRHLAFVRGGDIYVAKENGDDVRQLTNTSLVETDPDWSPDGTRIAFSRGALGGTMNIWVMNADGSGAIALTSQSGVNHDPHWSPDGNSIAYSRADDPSTTGIYILPAAGGASTRISGVPAGIASWSPDGTRLVYSVPNAAGEGTLFTMRRDGSEVHMIASIVGFGLAAPAWGPDGRIAAWLYNVDYYSPYTSAIIVMNADGSNQVTIMDGIYAYAGVAPDWSPDGRSIAIAPISENSYTDDVLWVLQSDGTGQQSLHINGDSPDWRP